MKTFRTTMLLIKLLGVMLIAMGVRLAHADQHYALASWYGSFHQGRKTANGERFNMHALTAAHKKYPFGTILNVENIACGKSVRVRVTDRGPYHGNREIDLTKAAASKIDMLSSGTGKVKITVVSKPKKPETHYKREKRRIKHIHKRHHKYRHQKTT